MALPASALPLAGTAEAVTANAATMTAETVSAANVTRKDWRSDIGVLLSGWSVRRQGKGAGCGSRAKLGSVALAVKRLRSCDVRSACHHLTRAAQARVGRRGTCAGSMGMHRACRPSEHAAGALPGAIGARSGPRAQSCRACPHEAPVHACGGRATVIRRADACCLDPPENGVLASV